jgi:hypothetical protein
MADLAFAAAGGLPVRLNLPVPLQRPYAADPGTLTEWLVAKTANLGRDAALTVLAAMNAKYANIRRCEMFSFNSHGETYP